MSAGGEGVQVQPIADYTAAGYSLGGGGGGIAGGNRIGGGSSSYNNPAVNPAPYGGYPVGVPNLVDCSAVTCPAEFKCEGGIEKPGQCCPQCFKRSTVQLPYCFLQFCRSPINCPAGQVEFTPPFACCPLCRTLLF